MRELPKGWAPCALDECCTVISGQSPRGETYNDEGIGLPFYQGKTEFNDLYPVPRKWCTEPTKLAEDGDILISVRAPVGPTNLANETCCIGRGLAALRPFRGVETRFVLYQMRATEQQLASVATGSTFSAVSSQQLKEHRVVLAPSYEQPRIVAEIEKQFTRLDAATTALKRVQDNLKRYRASVLKAACDGRLVPTEAELARQEGRNYEPADKLLQRILRERRARWEADTLAKMQASGKVSNNRGRSSKYEEPISAPKGKLPSLPDGWAWTNLSELKQFSIYGPRFSSDDYTQDGIVVLRTTDISASGRVNLATAPRLQLTDAEWKKYQLMPGDLVFTRTGATVGKLALFDDEVQAIPGAYLIHYRLIFKEILPWYVYRFFQTEMGQSALLKGTRGIGQPNLNAPTIESVPIPLPPLDEQRRIVEALDEVINLQSRQTAAVETAQCRAGRLKQAVLRSAFTGQLVPQDPSDEPASILLERIRAERANQSRHATARNTKQKPKTARQRGAK
jgi:type I restriction enzyme S subunit